MRIFAIGDIHGHYSALQNLWEYVCPSRNDLVITLGDYVDHGSNSFEVIELLIELHSKYHLVSLRGNHEALMLNARKDDFEYQLWKSFGGGKTIASYPHGSFDNILDTHWHFIDETCVDWHETDSHIFVHGHVDPDLEMGKQPIHTLHWMALSGAQAHHSGKTVICGHTPQESGIPNDMGHTVCIDTVGGNGGWLSCLEITTMDIWQANENGATRQFNLTTML